MNSKVNITKAARLAGITRQTMSKKIKDGTLTKDSDGKIDISELLRVFPNITIDDEANVNSTLNINDELHVNVKLLEQENKYLKRRISDLEKQLEDTLIDKADLKTILKQQTATLPKPKKWGFFR